MLKYATHIATHTYCTIVGMRVHQFVSYIALDYMQIHTIRKYKYTTIYLYAYNTIWWQVGGQKNIYFFSYKFFRMYNT